MSTPTEDRLRAALHARAEQVQPADLRPLELPRERRGARRPLALGLVAAAAAAVVVVLLAQGTGSPDRTPPPPADSASPSPSPREGASMDVDGDGGPDRVHLDFDESTGQFTVRVDLFTGETLEANGVSAVPPELLTGFDLDSDTAAEVAVRAGVDPGQLPDVFTYVPDQGLVPVAFPEGPDGGAWRAAGADARWATRDGRLYYWAAPEGEAPDGVVDFWEWRLEGASAVPVGPTRRCLGEGVNSPVPCSSPGSFDVGPRGDLPALFPAVGKTYKVGETWKLGGAESVELAGRSGEYLEDGDVELVVHVDGIVARADVPAGGPPVLVGGRVRARGDAPVLVVQQEGGDSMTTTVFTFWNGELIALPQPTDAPFGDGFREVDGSMRYHRTWLSEEGVLYTAEGVDEGADQSRTRLWRWSDDFGKRLEAEDLGVACIDFSAEPPAFGRCP
ncbi:MAG: hypothetical protein ACTHKG_20825 [Nocardioides sp.]